MSSYYNAFGGTDGPRTKFFHCPTCGNQLGYCTCPKLYRVVSGSHKIHVQWGLGCFWATSADVASTVTESEKQYLQSRDKALSFEDEERPQEGDDEPEYDWSDLNDETSNINIVTGEVEE